MSKSVLFFSLLLMFLSAFQLYGEKTEEKRSNSKNSPLPIIAKATKFLAAPAGQRQELENELRNYQGDISVVLKALKESVPKAWTAITKSGTKVSFSLPELNTPNFKAQFPEACLFYYLPEKYHPDKSWGLLIYLHGGGKGIRPHQAGFYVTKYELDKRIKEARAPFIIVAPSYSNKENTTRWMLPKADKFIRAVIEESMYRFNIDPNRIVMSGFSMGASGSWHLGQRLADRWAACLVICGGYRMCNLKGFYGLPLFVVNGQYDGWCEQSRHYRGKGTELTDEERPPRSLPPDHWHFKLKELGIPHVLKWHQGGHTLLNEAKPGIERFAQWVQKKHRDPFSKKVFVHSPSGGNASIKGLEPTFHQRWVSILETVPGYIFYSGKDMKIKSGKWRPQKGESFKDYKKRCWVKQVVRKQKGASVEAGYLGKNQFRVKTRNVKKLSLWLAPEMVDFSKPVNVNVNGKEMIFKNLKPNLADALRSYERRRDWGLIYPCELVIDVPDK